MLAAPISVSRLRYSSTAKWKMMSGTSDFKIRARVAAACPRRADKPMAGLPPVAGRMARRRNAMADMALPIEDDGLINPEMD